jgi:fido (protein-threonine AMPylation protein)/DNA-binding XRE family transcriptional regulator
MKDLIKNARISKGLKTRELAQAIAIDQALISKFESGSRIPTEDQIRKIAHILDLPEKKLLRLWLKDKLLKEIKMYDFAGESLLLVHEELTRYGKTTHVFDDNLSHALTEIKLLFEKLQEFRHQDSYRIAQALELEYTFESNRIEGNTLTLRETDLVVNEGLTISGKSMREHLEAINHQEAIEYVKELVAKNYVINERELLAIHNLILRGISPKDAGVYRTVQVMIKGASHIPPSAFEVEKEMKAYFKWYENNRHTLHPVVLAADMHEKLVTIHPFIDGNGRTARLVMNLILLQNGYVIANIKGDYATRMKYYDSLEQVQTNTDAEKFRNFLVEIEKECLNRHISIISK